MADQWYFASDSEKVGPFSGAQLKELGALGKLQPTDTVWKAGIEKGVLAETVKHLFPHPAKAIVRVADEPSLPPRPSNGLSSFSISNTSAKLEPWLPSSHDQALRNEEDLIPDGLMLKALQDQNGSVNSPDSEKIDERTPEPSPAMAGATDPGPKSPSITNSDRPSTQKKSRKARVIGVKGAIIIGQDGEIVQYRKKCLKCAYQDTCRTTMRIRGGATRERFFCPKCRKMSDVLIQGIT